MEFLGLRGGELAVEITGYELFEIRHWYSVD